RPEDETGLRRIGGREVDERAARDAVGPGRAVWLLRFDPEGIEPEEVATPLDPRTGIGRDRAVGHPGESLAVHRDRRHPATRHLPPAAEVPGGVVVVDRLIVELGLDEDRGRPRSGPDRAVPA